MRMVHYYAALAIVLAPALLWTLQSGAFHDGSDRHLVVGVLTSVLCVAASTLLILFMIVTGRILKAAVAARSLPAEFLDELNEFFARKRAYPVALLAAAAAVATAVLGHGRFIGVPTALHMLLGLVTVMLNLSAIAFSLRTLRANQDLLDRAARLLDEIDARAGPTGERSNGEGTDDEDDGVPWAFSPRTRWRIFATCAWLPYAYWGGLVWHGDFSRVPAAFLIGTASVSALSFLASLASTGSAGNEGASG